MSKFYKNTHKKIFNKWLFKKDNYSFLFNYIYYPDIYTDSFLGTDSLTIHVNEPASNIILKELEWGDVSLPNTQVPSNKAPRYPEISKIHVTKNNPFSLETGQTLDCTTERSFGPLEKFTECSGLGNFLAYHALYAMPGLSVSMGPILYKNLSKISRSVAGSPSREISDKAA
ncbi:MAG: hypothetical protein ACRCTK_05480 [Alphaproteobacteria bacterium]